MVRLNTAHTLKALMGLGFALWMGVAWAATSKGDGKESEPVATNETYIAQWQGEALRQMEKYGIPASITLAQGIWKVAMG